MAEECSALWWKKNPETDAGIRRRFEDAVRAAGSGGLDDWTGAPAGRLALILLTDQFPRNIYRDRPGAFGYDPVARSLCLEGCARAHDRTLRPIERVFFYMPLQHAEDLALQERSVGLFRDLADAVPPAQRPTFAGFLDFARRHHAIIERFGRFPHRNAILGRPSTPAELEFLQQPGSSF